MNKIPIEALPVLSVVFLCLWFLILRQLLPFIFFLRATHLVINSLRFCTWVNAI
jgi:hypothetical protein